MRRQLLEVLSCPHCKSALKLTESVENNDVVVTGILSCTGGGHEFPVRNAVPRFVASTSYADNFGLQWNVFRRTQLDSHSGTTISSDRFFRQSGWRSEDLRNALVLDVGCGAGRFAEIALSAGAKVVALDYSSAVDACYANLGTSSDIEVVQADIYHLPFKSEAFDFVYCFGVLQHTPDVRAAFMSLPRHLRKGGSLAVDIYPKLWRNVLIGKYWVRPFTKRISKERLIRAIQVIVPRVLPVVRVLGRLPLLGRVLRAIIPISNYEGVHDLNATQLNEWAILDTYDMLGPAHDQPQARATLMLWFKEIGFERVEVFRAGHLVGRGIK